MKQNKNKSDIENINTGHDSTISTMKSRWQREGIISYDAHMEVNQDVLLANVKCGFNRRKFEIYTMCWDKKRHVRNFKNISPLTPNYLRTKKNQKKSYIFNTINKRFVKTEYQTEWTVNWKINSRFSYQNGFTFESLYLCNFTHMSMGQEIYLGFTN